MEFRRVLFRSHVFAASALEVLVPLGLAAHLLEIPADPAHCLDRVGPHRDLPEVASLRWESSYSRTACLSCAVAKGPAGATRCEGWSGTSVVGSPPIFAALIQTGIALAITVRVSNAKRAVRRPSTVTFVMTCCIWSSVFAGLIRAPLSSAA